MKLKELAIAAVAIRAFHVHSTTKEDGTIETDILACVEDVARTFHIKPRPGQPQKGTPEYEALREEWMLRQ